MKKLILSILFVLTCSIGFSQVKYDVSFPLDTISKKINKPIVFIRYTYINDTLKVDLIMYRNPDYKTYTYIYRKDIEVLYPELITGIIYH
jgi:hypothetical protein